MLLPFNWICPHCDHAIMVTDANYRIGSVELWLNPPSGHNGETPMHVEIIDCPNEGCRKSTLTFCINRPAYKRARQDGEIPLKRGGGLFESKWTLIPPAGARVFPDYVPEAIREDYTEACVIRDLSPKASATLARRYLQGMIRDFHGITKNTLFGEINALKDKVEPAVWGAIDGIREIGNIGAHMEKDVNVIIDVDPDEAAALIELIEILIKDWYIVRHERDENFKRVKEIAGTKKSLKKPAPPPEVPPKN